MTVATEQKPLLGKLRLNSILHVETGLHIGGGGENLAIGGLDKPIIRDPLTQQPYLPGSSIKGKLRSILERLLNKPVNRPGGSGTYRYESDDLDDGFSEVDKQFIAFQGARTCPLSRIFGSTGTNCWLPTDIAQRESLDRSGQPKTINGKEYVKVKGRNSPARLIVRDSHLTDESADKLKQIDTGLYMTEWKFENGIDRITAAANPRQLERVPAGSRFKFEIVYTVENSEQAIEDLKHLAIALAILEDDALGGHGSRGYGKIRFEDFQVYYRNVDQYRQLTSGNGDFLRPIQTMNDTADMLENFAQLTNAVQQRLLPADSATEES